MSQTWVCYWFARLDMLRKSLPVLAKMNLTGRLVKLGRLFPIYWLMDTASREWLACSFRIIFANYSMLYGLRDKRMVRSY